MASRYPDFTPEELQAEEWRTVVEFPGWYEVSNLGRVRRAKSGKSTQAGRMIKPTTDEFGYHFAQMSIDGVKRSRRIQGLVAEAFICPRPQGEEANHKDIDKTNNRVENLEWVTRRGNAEHAVANGCYARRKMRGERQWKARLTDALVAEIKAEFRAGGVSKQDLVRKYAHRWGVSKSTIWHVLCGHTWRHVA